MDNLNTNEIDEINDIGEYVDNNVSDECLSEESSRKCDGETFDSTVDESVDDNDGEAVNEAQAENSVDGQDIADEAEKTNENANENANANANESLNGDETANAEEDANANENENKGEIEAADAEDDSDADADVNTEIFEAAEAESAEPWDEMIVYDQDKKIRDTGDIIYKGEDAYPYMGKELCFVADGLGGNGAARHYTFDKRLFDEDMVVSALFEGIFDDITDPEFTGYVKRSFKELRDVKHCYFWNSGKRNIDNYKHSAYFGSRLVCAIILQMMKEHGDKFSPDKLFETIKNSTDRERLMHELEVFIAGFIRSGLLRICDKAHFVIDRDEDRRNTGLQLMSTTLCAAIYRENEDCVDVFYISAGDCKAYMWNENGLHLMVKDQESADGGMTNHIFADEKREFAIKCKYVCVKKPCVLFNSTDGCFDAFPFKVSPLAFERYILETVSGASSLKEAGRMMGEYFMSDSVRDDDSSTMAMKLFGYCSLEELKERMRERLATIQTEYLDSLGDLLLRDHSDALYRTGVRASRELKGLKASVFEDEAVKNYCRQAVGAGDPEKYKSEIGELDGRIRECRRRLDRTEAALTDILYNNYEFWIEEFCTDMYSERAEELSFLRNKRRTIFGEIKHFERSVAEKMTEAERLFEQTSTAFERFTDHSRAQELPQDRLRALRRGWSDICDFLDEVSSGRARSLRQIQSDIEDYFKANRRLAGSLSMLLPCEFAKRLLSVSDIDAMELFEEEKAVLRSTVALYREQLTEMSGYEREKMIYVDKEAVIYYDKAYMDIIGIIVGTGLPGIGGELSARVSEVWSRWESEKREIAEKADKQIMLFGKYDLEYGKYTESEECCQ